jgi:hypothetical protein
MREKMKTWQTTLWLVDSQPEPVVLYGESPEAIQTAVATWLEQHQLAMFANAPSRDIPRQNCYFYSDGWLEVIVNSDGAREVLPTGWHYKTSWQERQRPLYLGSWTALLIHLEQKGILIEPGPDYQKE